MEKHIYKGNCLFTDEIPCEICGMPGRHPNHWMNALDVCDTLDGPCSCGAWHYKGERIQYV